MIVMRGIVAALTGAVLLAVVSGVAQAGDMRGAMLANPCAGCHGTDGKSPGPIPGLQGLPEAYLIDTMKAFRDGKRPATVMDRIAKGYTDEEIELMAAYLAKAGK
ncbi:MAG: c-type cytochrome [Chromatiales bacterium]|jgi:sulfide dehydrogenase cytochrome subunit